MTEQTEANVEHQKSGHRFILALGDGAEAELTYVLHGETMVLNHTGVPPAFQHRGLADRLARAALGYAREHGFKVDPECRFMAVYLQRHPEEQDLLATPNALSNSRDREE